jgi:tetratricopeptide (TPR) repeat protein
MMGSRFPDKWLAWALLLFLAAASLGLAQTTSKKAELDRSLAAFAKVYESDRYRQLGGLAGYPELIALFEEYFKQNIAVDCGNAPATWYLAGSFYQRNGLWGEAVRCFTRALEEGFVPWEAYSGRSYCYARQGDIAKAIADADKVIELAPEVSSSFAYEHRADIYAELGNYSQAISDYTEAIKIQQQAVKKAPSSGDHVWLLYELVRLYQRRSRAYLLKEAYGAAIDDLRFVEKQLDPGPSKASVYRDIAAIYRKKGDDKSANKYLRMAQAMDAGVKR